KIRFHVYAYFDRPVGALILSVARERQPIDLVQIFGALQSVQKSHHGVIVAVHSKIDGDFLQTTLGNFLLLKTTSFDLRSGLSCDAVEFRGYRRIAVVNRQQGLLEAVAVPLNRGSQLADGF